MNLITAAAIALHVNTLVPEAEIQLKKAEGFCATPYLCPAGKNSIGYGHVIQDGEHFPEPLSEAQATALMRDDLAKAEGAVQRLVKVPLSDNQYSALVLLVFNIGDGNFGKSTLLKRLNQFHYYEAAQHFDEWVYSKKKILPGLVVRRAAEKALFLEDEHVG